MNNLITDIKKFWEEILQTLDYICLVYPTFYSEVETTMWISLGVFIMIAFCLTGSL